MTALTLQSLSLAVFLTMVVMTIQGDLKDILSDENNIPDLMGVDRVTDGADSINFPLMFIVVIDSMVVMKFVALSIATLPRVELVSLIAFIGVVCLSANFKIMSSVSSVNMERATSYITYYTALVLVALCIALVSVADVQSVVALLLFSFVWGFSWQKIQYGSFSQFG